MRSMRYKTLWRLVPFLLLITGLLIPSCGFIGLLFDSGKDGKSTQYYDLQMGYDYWGGRPVDFTTPLGFLFIPLDHNNQFDDQSFDNASYKVAYIPSGVITVESLKEGPYAVLGYVDSDGDGELSMDEVYAFYYMRDLVSTFRDPDYIMVDSSVGEWKPQFDFEDFYVMDGLLLIVPENGETLYGEHFPGDFHFIQILGISIEKSIDNISIYIDSNPYKDNINVAGEDPWIVIVDMYGKIDGNHTMTVQGYAGTTLIDSYSVNFNYVGP